MKKCFFITLLFVSMNLYSQSRLYRPVSEYENQFYQKIDKNIWPDDIRNNIDSFKETLVGWVGIVEKFMIDTTNEEYNIIMFYVRHHYYDWIEDFGIGNKPIRLSPDGEGYFVCNYLTRKEFDTDELTKDIIGDCIMNYGYPLYIDDDTIIMSTNYLRHIVKEYVNSNWLKYGRNGFDIMK